MITPGTGRFSAYRVKTDIFLSGAGESGVAANLTPNPEDFQGDPVRLVRPALCLALAATAAAGTVAFAADAPKTTDTSKSLFLSQNGCGSTQEDGRLEPKIQNDTSDGCGTIGGIPINELAGLPTDFTSTSAVKPFKIDAAKKVTGQVSAGSWTGTGGVGTVDFDLALVGTTSTGKTIDFGEQTVSGSASPATNVVSVPFTFSVPASAKGATFKRFTFSMLQRGMNVGMSAQSLNGNSYVVIPAKK
jgi:hypothetical protein